MSLSLPFSFFFLNVQENRIFEMFHCEDTVVLTNFSFSLSFSLEFCRISTNGTFYDEPLFTFRALGFLASIFFLTICVYRDNMILAKHAVLYLCKSWLVFQIGNKWRALRP